MQEKFEDTKGVIRKQKRDRQYNDKKKECFAHARRSKTLFL